MENGTLVRALGLLVTLLTVAAPFYAIYQAYDIWRRGSIPEKFLQVDQLAALNPLRDLSALGDRVSLSLEGVPISNLYIAQARFKNTGQAPILPTDFHESLSVSVDKPWKIVAVENSYSWDEVQFKWHRDSDTKFVAEATLINPGDDASAAVYLTNTEFESTKEAERGVANPPIHWNVRIANLQRITSAPDLFEREMRRSWGIEVSLAGWALPFTIVASSSFLALYLVLARRNGYLQQWGWGDIASVVLLSLLSFAAAESIATYLFGNLRSDMFGINHRVNLPFIVAHVCLLVFLYYRARHRRT